MLIVAYIIAFAFVLTLAAQDRDYTSTAEDYETEADRLRE